MLLAQIVKIRQKRSIMINTYGTRPASWYADCAPDYLDGDDDDRESREYDRADDELHRRYDDGE